MHVRIPALIAIATSLTLVGAAPAERARMEAGLQALCDAVKVTLGPKGQNVVIERKFGAPTITVDGVSVAKELELDDPASLAGAELIREVAKLTNDQVDAVNECLKA